MVQMLFLRFHLATDQDFQKFGKELDLPCIFCMSLQAVFFILLFIKISIKCSKLEVNYLMLVHKFSKQFCVNLLPRQKTLALKDENDTRYQSNFQNEQQQKYAKNTIANRVCTSGKINDKT